MERVCGELIRRAHYEFDVTIVAATLASELRGCVPAWHRVSVPRRPFPLKYSLFWIRAANCLRGLEVDLIHAVGAITPRPVDVASIHFCSAGFVQIAGGLAPERAPLPRRINTSLARTLAIAGERWCYRPGRLAAFAAVSSGVGEEVSRLYPGIPVHITPNGVDHDRFRPDPAARRQLRAASGLGEEPLAIFVGGDWDRKGLPVVLEALARARSETGCDLRLWVVGAGDRRRFQRLARQLGVGEAVSFLGARGDVERCLAAADIFVLPSLYETFGLVAFEAAACGLPVIATPVHGLCELIGDGGAGILVEREPASIADALRRLALDPALRRALGETARRRSERYTWQASAEAVMELYRSLLSERAQPAGRRGEVLA